MSASAQTMAQSSQSFLEPVGSVAIVSTTGGCEVNQSLAAQSSFLEPVESDAKTEIPTLPLYPDFADKFTSFMSDAEPEATIEQIENLLARADIRRARGKERASLRAIFWPNGRPVDFRIAVFKDRWESGHPYVVEFQRRAGDAFAFRTAYRVLTDSLPASFNAGPLPNVALAPFGGVPIASALNAPVTNQSLAQHVRPDPFPMTALRVLDTVMELEKGTSHREQALLMLLHWAEHNPVHVSYSLQTIWGWREALHDHRDEDPTIRRARFRLLRLMLEAHPAFVNRLDRDLLFAQCAKEMDGRDPTDDSLDLADLDEEARGLIRAIMPK
jgi:hypothetical protein